jgi:hypothetical protein
MISRIRLLAGSVTLAGAALLGSSGQANATMPKILIEDPFGTRYCCAADTNGDGKPDLYCCYGSGCSASGSGCVRAS